MMLIEISQTPKTNIKVFLFYLEFLLSNRHEKAKRTNRKGKRRTTEGKGINMIKIYRVHR